MTTLKSYDLNGKKLSFANWISNLSPQDVPFTSMTGKESIDQTLFQWQTDSLSSAGDNAQAEGGDARSWALKTTSIKSNITQILRKTVKVSDTANALANYGRGKELQYQMEKAGKEIKRDLELAFLTNHGSVQETATLGRETAGFHGLVAPLGSACTETGAVVHKLTTAVGLSEADLFDLTYNLYMAGSMADIIMFHPKHASFFSSLQEKTGTGAGAQATRERIFEDTPRFSVYVSTMVDPLGQEYKLLPNRWMPEESVFFFRASDWTQMILRAPQRVKLAKDGSYEKWMIEMEVGLRHRHPYASGILEIKATGGKVTLHDVAEAKTATLLDNTTSAIKITTNSEQGDMTKPAAKDNVLFAGITVGKPLLLNIKTGAANPQSISVLKDGVEVFRSEATGAQDFTTNKAVVIANTQMSDAGLYTVVVEGTKADGTKHEYNSYGFGLQVFTNSGFADPTSVKAKKKVKAKVEESVVEAPPVLEEAPVAEEAKAATKKRASKKA